MIKLIISGGDSFTFGNELTDDNENHKDTEIQNHPSHHGNRWLPPSKLCWANLVAEKLQAKHINTALSGRSNSFITRRVMHKIHKALSHPYYKSEDLFVQVMWTFNTRQEIAVNKFIHTYDRGGPEGVNGSGPLYYDREDSPWFPIDPHIQHVHDFQNPLNDGTYKMIWEENKEIGYTDFVEQYYKVTDELNDHYSSLKDILFLQEFLENRNIKYMFTYVSKEVMKGISGVDDITKGMRSFIKYNKWFKFPGKTNYVGFNDWAKANGYSYGIDHPLEQAHEDAAELIYEKVKTITQRPGSLGSLSGE